MAATQRRPVSIVIPHLNGLEILKACIRSIKETAGHPDYEIIVVDGGSTDGSLEWLGQEPGIQLVSMPQRGVAMAINVGIARTGRRDVVRVHSDVVFETEGWLDLLAGAAEELPAAGVIGATLLLPDGRIHSSGRNILTGVGIHERHSYRRQFAADGGPGTPVEVDAVAGAVCYMKREVLDRSGGLDERYWPQYLDDDDLCMMARHAGFKVYVHEGVKAIHHSSVWTPTTGQHIRGTAVNLEKLAAVRRVILNGHISRWHEKWGFNPVIPDLAEIRRLYGGTEICWRIGEPMRFHCEQWPPTVDIVMVTWNNRAVLERCLDSLATTRYDLSRLHLHIADNGSKDGTLEYLEELATPGRFPFRITVHSLPVNTGVAVGFNWSIVKGDGQLVARMDDDVIVPPEWLERLVEGFRRRPYAGAVGPKILNDNPIHDIQCGPFRMYPFIYAHENEPDQGQADYVARVAHIRGCLNVYRRDTLEACGLFDLRFSPSQFDDPDHHAAMLVCGYELIYDGRVGVIHALNSGAGRTWAALSNQKANQSKLYGKWGQDIWKTLDQAIELSHEGRHLPLEGDTSAFLAGLTEPAAFPSFQETELTPAERNERLGVLEIRDQALAGDGLFGEIWSDMREQARALRRDGNARIAVHVLHSLVDLQPRSWRALHDLALTYVELGENERARPIAIRAQRLAPDEPEANDLVARICQADRHDQADLVAGHGSNGASPADRSSEIGEPTLTVQRGGKARGMKVLMVNTFERRVAGGDMHQIKKTAQHLEQLGVDVTVQYTASPDPRGYDLVHVWNLWFPHQTLPQLKGIKVAAPDIPVVMTPIYWDMSEKDWADKTIPRLFAQTTSPQELQAKLSQLAGDTLTMNGRRRSQRAEPNYSGYWTYQREILEMVDHLLPNSEREVVNLRQTLGVSLPYTVIHNGAEPAVFDAATPDLFREKYGLSDFILTVGLVENRKNQLMMLHALKNCGIPLVVIGRNYDRTYLRLCQRHAPPDTLFIEHLPHEELASAMKAARVFALPSWMECASFANVEAALAGCAMVVSDRTSEPEYFGDRAYYCDPASVDSIRDAIMKAYRYYETDAPKREQLREQFTRMFTWENAAARILGAYQQVLGSGAPSGRTAETSSSTETVLSGA